MKATVSYLLMLQNQLKAKRSEIKDYALCLDYISKDFTINNIKKTGLKRIFFYFFFFVDFNHIDTNDILNILTKRT